MSGIVRAPEGKFVAPLRLDGEVQCRSAGRNSYSTSTFKNRNVNDPVFTTKKVKEARRSGKKISFRLELPPVKNKPKTTKKNRQTV
jgi:hypothetical protein